MFFKKNLLATLIKSQNFSEKWVKFQNSSPIIIGKEMEIYTPAICTYIANEQGSDIGSKGVKGVKGFSQGFNAVLIPTGISVISAIGDIGPLKLEFSWPKHFSKIVKSILRCCLFKGPTFKKKL